MPNLRASVLIDTYNHERFIERAITSVLEQDMPMDGVEVLVVDDGSTDSTPDIVRRFEPRVRLIRKANGGQASAFNVGIPECRGDIVAFLDGDDWWAPQRLRRVLETFERDSETGIVGNGIVQVFENGVEETEVLRDGLRFRIDSLQGARLFRRRKSQMGTSRMAVRTKILRQILPIPEEIFIEADEYIFTLAAALSFASIVAEPLTYYRIHGGNLFFLSGFQKDSVIRKEKSMAALARAISGKLSTFGTPPDATRAVVGHIQAEADQMRLRVTGGFPWETVRTEWSFYSVVHEDAPISHRLFKMATLIPALFCSPRFYYRVRSTFAASDIYLQFRKAFFPIPKPRHVARTTRRA